MWAEDIELLPINVRGATVTLAHHFDIIKNQSRRSCVARLSSYSSEVYLPPESWIIVLCARRAMEAHNMRVVCRSKCMSIALQQSVTKSAR